MRVLARPKATSRFRPWSSSTPATAASPSRCRSAFILRRARLRRVSFRSTNPFPTSKARIALRFRPRARSTGSACSSPDTWFVSGEVALFAVNGAGERLGDREKGQSVGSVSFDSALDQAGKKTQRQSERLRLLPAGVRSGTIASGVGPRSARVRTSSHHARTALAGARSPRPSRAERVAQPQGLPAAERSRCPRRLRPARQPGDLGRIFRASRGLGLSSNPAAASVGVGLEHWLPT